MKKTIFYASACAVSVSLGLYAHFANPNNHTDASQSQVTVDEIKDVKLEPISQKQLFEDFAKYVEKSKKQEVAKQDEPLSPQPTSKPSSAPVNNDIEYIPIAEPTRPTSAPEPELRPTTLPPEAYTTETFIYTYEDYEKTILGTCPSQRDKSNSWEEGNRLNAIGIITSGDSKTSPMNSLKSYIELWWNSYKLGRRSGRNLMANLNDIDGFDNNWANSHIAFYIDFNGLFVNWDNSWDGGQSINATGEQVHYLDQLVSDGTNYLRWLDSTYKAKCPND